MIINDKQKKLLTKLLIDMRENQYYGKSLNKCTEKDISSNVLDVYNRLKPVTKKELLDNLEKVLSQEVVNDIAVSEILNVDQLSENHDRILETGEHRWYLEMTSGTSGFPFPIIKSAFVRYTEGAYILKCRKRIFNNASFANIIALC